MKGLYNKYKIEKTDGTPVDPDAKYMVLRYDKPDNIYHAAVRKALQTFAKEIKQTNLNFSEELDWELLQTHLNFFKEKEDA